MPIYSILLIFIESRLIDIIVDGVKTYKTLFIVTNNYDGVRDAIINDLNRGGTCFNGMGMFKGVERKVIYTTVSRTQFIRLKEGIHELDPDAFINVIDSSEILGRGFKEIEMKDK